MDNNINVKTAHTVIGHQTFILVGVLGGRR